MNIIAIKAQKVYHFLMTWILFAGIICENRCGAIPKPPSGGLYVEMMGFLGMGNTLAVEEALKD